MAPDLDAVRRELVDLAEQLAATPADDFARRMDIRSRQEELREIVRTHLVAGDLLSADQLRRQIGLLRDQIERHHGNRLSASSGPQTGMGGGIDPKALHEMHRRMDAAADLEGMRRRLRHLEDQLSAYEAGSDDSGR